MKKRSLKIVVCFSSVPFVYGGAEVLRDSLTDALKSAGHQVYNLDIPFKWYPKTEIIKNCIAWRLVDIIESNGESIDLVIATKFPSYLIKHPRKITWLVHQMREAYDLEGTEFDEFKTPEELRIKRNIKKFDKKALSESQKIFTISKNVSKRLKKYSKLDSSVLYPSLKNEEKYSFGCQKDFILYSGRIDPKKRIESLIRVAKWLKSELSIKITGNYQSAYGAQLQNLAKKEGVAHKIQFTGFVSDEEIRTLYAECLAVYYAPIDEDYGYSTIEAYKSQKPMITAPDSGGVLEFVEDGINGYVIPANQYEKIATTCNKFFLNKSLARKMGKMGYKKIQNINWKHIVETLTQ